MPYYLIMCRSLTYAQRAARVLEQNGISGIVTKAPQGAVAEGGCAYCVKVAGRRLADALTALNGGGFEQNKVFLLGQGGDLQEVPR